MPLVVSPIEEYHHTGILECRHRTSTSAAMMMKKGGTNDEEGASGDENDEQTMPRTHANIARTGGSARETRRNIEHRISSSLNVRIAAGVRNVCNAEDTDHDHDHEPADEPTNVQRHDRFESKMKNDDTMSTLRENLRRIERLREEGKRQYSRNFMGAGTAMIACSSENAYISRNDMSDMQNIPFNTSIRTIEDLIGCEKKPTTSSNDDDDTRIRHDFSPNSPHPAIEFPPLYFILKRFPKILNAIESLYVLRWHIKYPLQRPVILSKRLRKIGIRATWGECLLILPFLLLFVKGLITSFVHPSVSQSGAVARLPLIICFLTATHNSILTFFIGIPFDRAIKYHKISGYLTFFNGMFHAVAAWVAYDQKSEQGKEVLHFASNDQINMSGTLILCIIFSMILTASPFVRRKAFEVFYYFHILFAITMMGCAFYHSGALVPVLTSILWGGDLMIRQIYMARFRYPRKASIHQLTDTVVEVRIPKTQGFDYNPGQVSAITSFSIQCRKLLVELS